MNTRRKIALGVALTAAVLVPAGAAFAASTGGSNPPSMTEMHDRMHAGTGIDPSQMTRMMQRGGAPQMMGSYGRTHCDPDTMAAHHQAMLGGTATTSTPGE